jgi:hypothetical protein
MVHLRWFRDRPKHDQRLKRPKLSHSGKSGRCPSLDFIRPAEFPERDYAHAIETEYRGRKAGTIGIAVF